MALWWSRALIKILGRTRGYILAFPRTEGNILGTNHQTFGWDLQYLVGALQAENTDPISVLSGGVAPATALMGHSMGGGGAFLATDSLCQNNSPHLKALVGLAPAKSTTNGVSSIMQNVHQHHRRRPLLLCHPKPQLRLWRIDRL